MSIDQRPIKFGTDGWRGVIADNFTFERLALVAPVAARVLAETYGSSTSNQTIVVGYDRRFLSEEFAETVAEVVQAAGFDVLLSTSYAPTPAFSWVAHHRGALGALVITASHNPGKYSGLKIKGAFGGSVPPAVTQQVEAKLAAAETVSAAAPGKLERFDPWPEYCEVLRDRANLEVIRSAIQSGKLSVIVDTMHGATAGGLAKVLGEDVAIEELRSDRDPLFGGSAPEPLAKYLTPLLQSIRDRRTAGETGLIVGFAFDGDGDRIAAADGQGNFLSSQILIPILLEHLAVRRKISGEAIKTISGSDLIPKIVDLYNLSLHETPIGYKYIADRMLEGHPVVLGGEESGGIGYGTHIPERDGLLSALYVMEAVAQSGLDLSDLYRRLQEQVSYFAEYDRIDLPLDSMETRSRLLEQLQNQPLTTIAGQTVTDCNTIDGYKFRLAEGSWLLIRFSGTEPVLRLYSEAATLERVHEILAWAKDWANSINI